MAGIWPLVCSGRLPGIAEAAVWALRLAEGRSERFVSHPGRELSGAPGREKSATSSGPVGTDDPGSTLAQASDGNRR